MNKCPTALLMADIHLRESTPKCRTGNFIKTQEVKLEAISGLLNSIEEEYGCRIPILAAGDIFHNWKPSPWLLSFALSYLPELICIPGQHDLPQHNIDNFDQSGLWTLYEADKVFAFQYGGESFARYGMEIWGFPFGEKLQHCKSQSTFPKVALVHTMVWKSKQPFPGAKGRVHTIMNKLKGYDLIVSGDNHIPFTHKRKGQLLVNPGSMTRQRASETHKPRVYIWYADENEVEPFYLPIEDNVISREHLEREEKKDERIEAYTESLNSEIDLSLNFNDNLKEFYAKNRTSKAVRQKVSNAMEEI